MILENYFAAKFMKSIRKNKFSIVVITVIAVSMIFFISAVSIMNGYIYGIMKIAFEVKTFHVDYPVSYSLSEAESILNKIKKNQSVLYADMYRESKVLLTANGKNTGIAYFRSMPENIFHNDKGFNECIKIMDGEKSLNKNEVLLSEKTASKLKVKTGDQIYITGMLEGDGAKFTLKRLIISGIFTTGYQELDEQLAFIGSETGDNIFESEIEYNIFIKLNDYKNSKKFIIENIIDGYFGMISWEDANYNELTALKFEKNVIAFIVVLVIFVAMLNILTTMFMTVVEKKKDIMVLKAVGYPAKKIFFVFLLSGIYIGLLGVVLGSAMGLFVVGCLNKILIFISAIINFIRDIIYYIVSNFISIDIPEKFEIFSKDFYLDKIYTDISFIEIFIISITALLFSIAASIIPAINAGKLRPIEVLKDE